MRVEEGYKEKKENTGIMGIVVFIVNRPLLTMKIYLTRLRQTYTQQSNAPKFYSHYV